MVLESTVICVDNSDYMRNGDFVPNRLQAEQDAVNLICQCKLRMHPENNVALLSMGDKVEVHSTLTNDNSQIFMKMHQILPKGTCNFIAGIRVAHLALKHRMGRNHKTRIVMFIGSPVLAEKDELVKLAKKLKKEKVNVDLINFGEVEENEEKLDAFIEALNGKDTTTEMSHLVTVRSGSQMNEALLTSPVLAGDDGAPPPGVVVGAGGGSDFLGVDPNEDPELALALRVSMEEQRARQEEEARRAGQDSETTAGNVVDNVATPTDMDTLSEEEQIRVALAMSLEQDTAGASDTAMETGNDDDDDDQLTDLVTDPEVLKDIVSTLPGVDPNSKEIQQSLADIKKSKDKKDGNK